MDVIHSRKIMRKFRIQDSLIVLYAGRHLDSLRQLRLNREGRPDAGALAPTRERFSVFEHATQPEQVERETQLIKWKLVLVWSRSNLTCFFEIKTYFFKSNSLKSNHF